jgi:uncharacterized protein (TIGR00251 family)
MLTPDSKLGGFLCRDNILKPWPRTIKLMDLRDALSPHPLGLTIRFEVAPGSSKLEVPSGFNPWRRALEARLTEEPSRGKANRQLTEEVARLFSLPTTQVEVLSGHKSARKVLLVRGRNTEDALEALHFGNKP